MANEIPVYLFVGFLESGKTKFIQETFEDPNFDSGDKTLLLVCEEGEVEYDPSKFAFGGVHVAQIEDKSELTQENLTALEKKSGCGRVIIEYNGMWLVQELYDAMPDNWLVYQCLATADGTTIKTYAGDSAMRSLLLDKIRGSELLVVNRAEAVNDDESRQLIHKVEGEHIREIEKDELFDVEFFLHSSTPRSFVLTLTFSLCWALDCSLLRESFCLRDCFSFCLTVLAENSLNA